LDARIHGIQERIKSLQRKLEGPQTYQIGLDGKGSAKPHQIDFEAAKYRQEIESLTTELVQVEASQKVIAASKEVPLVWDIAFVEIFESEKDGFDIVVGNPPYVRQEAISDPRLPRDEVTTENKKVYKEKLARSVYQAFPHFFGYNQLRKTAAKKIDAKSDLYIYFYLHGLSLLNKEGSFCFTTSNSWLDVGYGAELQEFLLKHNHVKLVLDNQVKRTFANADVNSVIVLFSATNDRREWALEKITRFVMFRVPFEHIVSAVIFDEIEEAAERKATAEYRIFPIQQAKLLEDGCEIPEEDDIEKPTQGVGSRTIGPLIKTARYIGNKWGGKYLRAPDIYWTILEKGKGKLVRLGDVAEVRRGFTTGANEFFYLDEEHIREWGIEQEFLVPVIKSPRECKRILIDPKDLKYKLFMCHKDKRELKGTVALEYIEWGEAQGFHERPSCSGRARWWEIVGSHDGRLAWAMIHAARHSVHINDSQTQLDHNFFEILTPNNIEQEVLCAYAISILGVLAKELFGRQYGGGSGPLKTDGVDIVQLPFISPSRISWHKAETRLFDSVIVGEPFSIEIQKTNTISKLDNIFFSTLELTQGERDAVYEAVINLVEARLNKASSV